jgi:hypothetical protein
MNRIESRTDVGLVPGCVVRFEAELRDLEPLRVRGVIGRARTVALRHVMHNGSDVVRPLERMSTFRLSFAEAPD